MVSLMQSSLISRASSDEHPSHQSLISTAQRTKQSAAKRRWRPLTRTTDGAATERASHTPRGEPAGPPRKGECAKRSHHKQRGHRCIAPPAASRPERAAPAGRGARAALAQLVVY